MDNGASSYRRFRDEGDMEGLAEIIRDYKEKGSPCGLPFYGTNITKNMFHICNYNQPDKLEKSICTCYNIVGKGHQRYHINLSNFTRLYQVNLKGGSAMSFELETVLAWVEKLAKMANTIVPAIRELNSIWNEKL